MHSRLASHNRTINLLDQEFDLLIGSLRKLTTSVPLDLLYKPTRATTIGENILRSAGAVEQTFGGISSNLWDDPFEWTLPETLSTPQRILEYLTEVEASKSNAFRSFADDDALQKLVAIPSGDTCTLLELLVKTLGRACDYRGRAVAMLKLLSDVSGGGFII